MTTLLDGTPVSSIEERERRFFFRFSLVLTGTVLVGFGAFILIGISSFASPWWVHVHAVSYVSWIALYVTQNLFVLRNNIASHRQLGWVGAVLAMWMVLVGLVLTPVTIAAERVPPFFTPNIFLALDWVNVTFFGGLVFAAIQFRRQTDWHRRLMLCATICVIAPALGRLLALAGAATPWNNVALLLIYVAAAMIADWRIRGRVHPAYYWGGGTIVAMAPAIAVLSSIPAFQELAAGF